MASLNFDEPPPVYDESPQNYGAPQQSYDFGGESADGFGQAGAYNPAQEQPVANGNFDAYDGATLPPPSSMGPEESIVLREWRRKRAIELEEKARVSREKHALILESSKGELDSFYAKRQHQVAQGKVNNREKEKIYLENLESLNAKAGGNYWEAVTAFVNFETQVKKEKVKAKGEPVRTSTLLNDAKPGKHTDLTRMRQVLLKLKHNPPAHLIA
eukprot:TRINITY_DN497_c0_g1_i1.p1 TRINITY_DN497_c0_g1~~TRINITY_DN497_c0_g1_i1.p1  ORF type:complete len:229 (-),score=39.14 TRINITY_DN497_c0_g1_i1:331-975(-)